MARRWQAASPSRIRALPLDEIGMRDIEAYKGEEARLRAQAEVLNNHLTILRKALSAGVAAGVHLGPTHPAAHRRAAGVALGRRPPGCGPSRRAALRLAWSRRQRRTAAGTASSRSAVTRS